MTTEEQSTFSCHPNLDTRSFYTKSIWKHEGLELANVSLRKRGNTGGITTLDFKLYYRDTIIKAA